MRVRVTICVTGVAVIALACGRPPPSSSAVPDAPPDAAATAPVVVELDGPPRHDDTEMLSHHVPFYVAQRKLRKYDIVWFHASDLGYAEREPFEPLDDWFTQELDPADPRIPARFALGRQYVVISEQGRARASVIDVGFHVPMTEWAGPELWVTLQLEAPIESALLLAFRAEHAPASLSPREPDQLFKYDDGYAELHATLVEQAEAFTDEHLELFPIEHADGPRFIASAVLTRPLPEDEVDEYRNVTESYEGGLAITDEHGEILSWLMPVDEDCDAGFMLSPRMLFDLEPDGTDELLVEKFCNDRSSAVLVDIHGDLGRVIEIGNLDE